MDEEAKNILDKYRSLEAFRGRAVDSFDDLGMDSDTPLHVAAYLGDLGAVRVMLPLVRSINEKGGIGNTPLHYAVMGGHADLVDLLLANGADLFTVNDYGDRPLDYIEKTRLP